MMKYDRIVIDLPADDNDDVNNNNNYNNWFSFFQSNSAVIRQFEWCEYAVSQPT